MARVFFYIFINTLSSLISWIMNKAKAIKILKEQLNVKIDDCGLIIDKHYFFLGSSPDGLIGKERSVVEVKCPYRGFGKSVEDCIQSRERNAGKNTVHLTKTTTTSAKFLRNFFQN